MLILKIAFLSVIILLLIIYGFIAKITKKAEQYLSNQYLSNQYSVTIKLRQKHFKQDSSDLKFSKSAYFSISGSRAFKDAMPKFEYQLLTEFEKRWILTNNFDRTWSSYNENCGKFDFSEAKIGDVVIFRQRIMTI